MSDKPQYPLENAPLGQDQQAALKQLTAALSPQQATWLSGFFAGFGTATAGQGGAAPKARAAAGPVPLTILYGSESGNSEACADKAASAAREAGFAPVVVDMGDYDAAKLGSEKNLLVIVSTWGEGDPPERAVEFHEFIMGDKAPSLKGSNFAVFALGDTSYAEFCECGKQFDKRFKDLGAVRVLKRADADVDFEEPFEEWLKAVLPEMAKAAGVAENTPAVSVVDEPSRAEPPAEPVIYGKKNPFPAPIKALVNLNGRTSAKMTCHLELSLEGSGLSYEPGDVAGVFPRNCPEVVNDFLQQSGLKGEDTVTDGDETLPLAEFLAFKYDITSLNASLMKKYAPLAQNKELDAFLADDNKDKLKDWLWGREIRDLFLEFPPEKPIPAAEVLGFLRKMPPRLYSIASSLRAHPGEVHLTVGAVTYSTNGLLRKGVCSTFLCERVKVGDTVDLYTHHNKNFFLPENGDTPIIMVGPGTGIAPFRAFVEERSVLGHAGRNWLFFGDQHFNSDFLYQLEWQDYLKKGILNRMDIAFSRDQPHKIYVQHRMREQARNIYAWMKEGAFFYVCGDANRMAKDVHQALIDIYAEQGGLSPEAAEMEVKELQKSKRYQRDVY